MAGTTSTTSAVQQQQGNALGLPALPAKAAQAIAAWAFGKGSGARATVATTYRAALAVAQHANGGNPVARGQVASVYLALGATAPGWARGAAAYAVNKGYTPWHSALWGTKHVALLSLQQGTHANGAVLYGVPAPVLASLASAMPANATSALASAANTLTAQASNPKAAGYTPCTHGGR
jgi:hypothetical protein